jgi:hypothetical protein
MTKGQIMLNLEFSSTSMMKAKYYSQNVKVRQTFGHGSKLLFLLAQV